MRRTFATQPAGDAELAFPAGRVRVRYHSDATHAARMIFVEEPAFDVEEPYSGNENDQAWRFAILCRAAVERARALNVDVVHLNDWQTGLVPVYARADGYDLPTVFAIHNIGYQGSFTPDVLPQIGVPWEFFRLGDGVEFHGRASFLKGGISLSDRVVTVSPTYSREIRTPEYGAGMEGLLQYRAGVLHGILNGIDPDTWNPETDRALSVTYSAETLARKEECRADLLAELGLQDGAPLLVAISRLAHQKGIDLIEQAAPALLDRGYRFALLGDGDAALEASFARLVQRYPGRAAAILRFDDRLARRMYAGADFFLMPSRYEPCGLGQMIAQRYGTAPIVRSTGGLIDTVEDSVTGFCFGPPTAYALFEAVLRAGHLWRENGWDALGRRCMRLDRSWPRSAEQYEAVYQLAIGRQVG